MTIQMRAQEESMEQQRAALGDGKSASWNRMEVNRCLLPILRFVDGEREGKWSPEEREQALQDARAFCHARPEAYRQLARVFTTGSDGTLEQWFGWIDCDAELLELAFDFIEDELNGRPHDEKPPFSPEEDRYFAAMFRVTVDGQTVNLAQPFEQFYFCDEYTCQDYLTRRIDLAQECRDWMVRYRPYYQRIVAHYRDHGGRKYPISAERHAYMQLYEFFLERMVYEQKLRDDRRALEYERGGLGWFHRDRKRAIERELKDIELSEMELRLEKARERYEAYEGQFERHRAQWQDELKNAPITAFARKKELKQKLAALDEQLLAKRRELCLDDLQAQYVKMCKKR